MQVAREPPEHVGWKGGLHETLQQQVMGHSVKGLRKIYCQRHSAAGGLPLIKARGYGVGNRK